MIFTKKSLKYKKIKMMWKIKTKLIPWDSAVFKV